MSGTAEHVDAVVLGASMRGLVTTYVLSHLGYRTVLIEKGRRIGGADSSFVTPGGTRFDHGLHVLDANRSELTTKLFTHVVDGRVHEVTLRRGIVLRNHILPYAPVPSEMPPDLRALLSGGELVDDLGERPPARYALASVYGRGFADLIYDEVLPSFPSEARHLAFGVAEEELLTNIYPWFFPRARRMTVESDESRAFHDRLRAGIPQRVLYPREGGFGGFAEGFVRHFYQQGAEVLTGASDLAVHIRPGSHVVESISASGRRFEAPMYFWTGPWNVLCRLLKLPNQHAATDRVLLGSLRLNRPALTDNHELLVGDIQHPINRLSFPARFRESDDPLVQIEFAVPQAADWPADDGYWRSAWLESLRRLGLIGPEHVAEEFDVRSFTMHFNAFGAEGARLRDADPGLIERGSNIYPVVPSMANLNLNRWVPRAVRGVAALVASRGDAGVVEPVA